MTPTAALALLVGLVYLAIAFAVTWGKPLHCQRVAYRSALRRWGRAAWYVGAGFREAWREVR